MVSKKLIEVSLPLDKINAASAREKSIRHGHPSTLHLWWARRPLAATRAVIWSSLVDDPSSHLELFPTEEAQNKERERLFKILSDLVVWENSNDQDVLNKAKKEILKYNDGKFPTLLDPFAGGGAIPLEAQRLGLHAVAHDLNPIPIILNKAMIEIPPRFTNMAPVNPDYRESNFVDGWVGAKGLAEDVRYYGEWLKKEAFKRVGKMYPKVQIPAEQGEGEATVMAWIWARTVKCPNPACGVEVPLIHSYSLSKKKNKEAYLKLHYHGKTFATEIIHAKYPNKKDGTVSRKGAICPKCGAAIDFAYLREESKNERMYSRLIAVVAEGNKSRIFLKPDSLQLKASEVEKPNDYPEGRLAYYPGHLNTNAYGLDTFDKLFTNRQLTTLTTLSSLVEVAQDEVEKAAITSGMANDHTHLRDGGVGAKAYGEAVGIYLAFAIDKLTDYNSSISSWSVTREGIRNTFGRQAIPMAWDFAEANPFCSSSGCWDNMVTWVVKAIDNFPVNPPKAEAEQFDAQSDCGLRDIMVSTDPPYYDNIGYSDLSDFFYVWLRHSIKNTYPQLFSTMVTPKAEELVATPYRHDGSKEKAKNFFEDGMLEACKQIYKYAREDVPVTIYYAYKHNDVDASGKASTGWETMLSAIIKAGFSITGTWPMRTEMANRNIATGTNALASSIVLVCRKRSENAPQTTRRMLIAELRRELRPALKKLQESNIAPVDLAQAAIGPGMSVFSRYKRVLDADGTPMTVRDAQKIINEEVDHYFNEQVGSMDTSSRFCIDLYVQTAYNDIKFGDAEILANAKGASIPAMVDSGVLYAKGGNVHLVERENLPEKVNNYGENIWLITQQLTYAMDKGGIDACAKIVAKMYGNNAENAKDLAYRLYTVAEQKKWVNEAFAYNSLVVAWPDIQNRATEFANDGSEQLNLFSDEDEDK